MNNIQTTIVTDLRSAKQSIKVAVSWLTDTTLINELIAAKRRGIEVKVIVSSNELNIIRFELFQTLIKIGGIVNKEGSEDPEQGNFMHYKFYIIDNSFAKSGSYNWSINATTNREALDPVSVSKKLEEFNDCLANSIGFFSNLTNPEQKRAELISIERESKNALTPEKLAAYRQAQIYIQDHDKKLRKEIEEKEKAAEALQNKLNQEKAAREKILQEQRAKDQQNMYGVKQNAPPVSEAPPRSYAI